MLTPEATQLAEEVFYMDTPEEVALALDRFAAQRGSGDWKGAVLRFAEAILHGDEQHQQWLRDAARAYVSGNELPLLPPQTGGVDAPHPNDGWTPEIMAEEARRFDEGLPAALDQFEEATDGGDAGERAREGAAIRKEPERYLTVKEQRALKGALIASSKNVDELDDDARRGGPEYFRAALQESRREGYREGAEAMREACAKAARGPGGHDECDHGAGYMDGRLDAALAIEALPPETP